MPDMLVVVDQQTDKAHDWESLNAQHFILIHRAALSVCTITTNSSVSRLGCFRFRATPAGVWIQGSRLAGGAGNGRIGASVKNNTDDKKRGAGTVSAYSQCCSQTPGGGLGVALLRARTMSACDRMQNIG